MNRTPLLRPVPAAAALALALLPGGCRGNPGKDALRAYEASVESLMGEDVKVSARLGDLKRDLDSMNARLEDQAAYGRDVALPFYRRFREAAAKAPASTEALKRIHGILLDYLEERTGYLESFGRVQGIAEGEDIAAFRKASGDLEAARKELADRTGGRLEDKDVQEAWVIGEKFQTVLYQPFTQGKVAVDKFQEALRGDVIPRFARVAERTKGRLEDPGADGAIARWSATEAKYYRQLAEAAPVIRALLVEQASIQEKWDRAEDLRAKFLQEIRGLRDSLR